LDSWTFLIFKDLGHQLCHPVTRSGIFGFLARRLFFHKFFFGD
jgi:hypothetical protein